MNGNTNPKVANTSHVTWTLRASCKHYVEDNDKLVFYKFLQTDKEPTDGPAGDIDLHRLLSRKRVAISADFDAFRQNFQDSVGDGIMSAIFEWAQREFPDRPVSVLAFKPQELHFAYAGDETGSKLDRSLDDSCRAAKVIKVIFTGTVSADHYSAIVKIAMTSAADGPDVVPGPVIEILDAAG